LAKWIERYGLACCCVLGPIVFALIVPTVILGLLAPKASLEAISIEYRPLELGAKGAPGATAAKAAPETTAAKGAPNTGAAADHATYLKALHLNGKVRYSAASVFLYPLAAAALAFSIVVVRRRLGRAAVAWGLAGFAALAGAIALLFDKPKGRVFAVDRLLNAAEKFEGLRAAGISPPATGDLVAALVSFNTFVSLLPVGMILLALAALSVRAEPSKLDRADLENRLLNLRIALGIGSSILVLGVIANKLLLEWPASLVADEQRAAMQPIFDGLMFQFGTVASVSLITAFAPAIVAWMLDVEQLHAKAKVRAKPKTESEAPPDGKLVFAPLSLVTSLLALLAPMLTSPFIDGFKGILDKVAGAIG
jgi:hypothetical protein